MEEPLNEAGVWVAGLFRKTLDFLAFHLGTSDAQNIIILTVTLCVVVLFFLRLFWQSD